MCLPISAQKLITLLNYRTTNNSLSVSTLVTPDSNYDSDNSRVQVNIKFSFDLFVSYHYSITVSTGKIEYTAHSTIGLLG